MALNEKQAAFVREYLVDLNATQAAIRAGYSEHTAGAIGHENLQKPEIQSAVVAGIQEREERTLISQDEVVKGLKGLAEDGGNPAPARVSAWSWLGRHLAMFTDKVEQTTPEPFEVVLTHKVDDEG